MFFNSALLGEFSKIVEHLKWDMLEGLMSLDTLKREEMCKL